MENLKDLIVKDVDVFGSQIKACKTDDGQIYAGIAYFCNAIGMTRGQRARQISNIQKDSVLSQGCIRLDAGSINPYSETYALRIDYLPLWLAKISITEKTKKENPELVEKLINFQLQAKEVLVSAFIEKTNLPQTVDEK